MQKELLSFGAVPAPLPFVHSPPPPSPFSFQFSPHSSFLPHIFITTPALLSSLYHPLPSPFLFPSPSLSRNPRSKAYYSGAGWEDCEGEPRHGHLCHHEPWICRQVKPA